MKRRLGSLLAALVLLGTTGCGEERELLSETVPPFQCTFLNRAVNLQCGLAHAFDLRVVGAEGPYEIELKEVTYDQNDDAGIEWAEDSVFTTTSNAMYPDSEGRWILVRRYVWEPSQNCELSSVEKQELQTRPHQITEVFHVTAANGEERDCELTYGITVSD